jgi:hypothetical protein
MIVTQGGRFGGYGFYVLKGKPVFLYNLLISRGLVGKGRMCCRQVGRHWSLTSNMTV